VDECGTVADAIDQLGQAIEDGVVRESGGRLLACRIELTGRTSLHSELLASTERLLAEARAMTLGLGEEAAWIERVLISTSSPEATTSRKDALGDLQRILGAAAYDLGLQAQLTSDLGDLVRKMPHDVRADVEDPMLKAATSGDTASLIARAGGYLSARLAVDGV
jgi:DNA repair protein SbcD/Mre11